MKITVLGTGYVGLVAGVCLSDSGNHVTCVDVDAEKVRMLQQGKLPIFERGLEDLVSRNARARRLSFTTSVAEALAESSVVFVAVGTPQSDSGASNLQYFDSAIAMVGAHVRPGTVVAIKSTVPVGTADRVREAFKARGLAVHVVSNPEFLKEGTAVDDFLRPERVLIGCEGDEPRHIMQDLYAPFTRSGSPLLFMSNRSAELAKYASNAFLAMKISFINEMALVAERCGADIGDVRRAITTDSRIGGKFLYPGCGYGGSCFPKDIQALVHLGTSLEMPMEMFRAVHSVNERQKSVLFEKMQRHFGGNLKGRTIAAWGLSFKPLTDDMREAPSIRVIEQLLAAGASVRAYDPVAAQEAVRIFGSRVLVQPDPYEVAKKADALVIFTEWNEFRSPDFERLRTSLTAAVIFDGRNLYDPESLRRQGFLYYSIGRQDPK